MASPVQSFDRHVHRPRASVVAALFWLLAVVLLLAALLFGWNTLVAGVVLLACSVAPLIVISRTYIVRLQDRIILLEMKVRAAEVLPAGEDARLAALSPKQIVALRFASDEELGALLERAVRDNLTPNDIKRAVTQWRADHLRT